MFKSYSVFLILKLLIAIEFNGIVFSFPIELKNDLVCPSVTFCECSVGTYYEIACPNRISANVTLRVEPQHRTNRVEIECNSENSDILNQLPEWNIGDANVVKLNGCPVSLNASVQRVFDRLGIRNVRSLIYFAPIGSNTTTNQLNNILPQQLFANVENVTSLDLRSNGMRLPKNIFQSLNNLEFLQISSTDLSNSADQVFHNLSKLNRLSLWNNNLRNLSKEIFSGVASVTEFEISSNDINELSSNFFEHLTAMESVNINSNRLISLPPQLFKANQALQKIRIVGNSFELNELPSKLFYQLYNLTAIWINDCNLVNVPGDLFMESTKLRNISMAHNRLREIPVTIFEHQINLVELDLSFNQLTSLDDGVFNETSFLAVLRLSHNRLSNISR